MQEKTSKFSCSGSEFESVLILVKTKELPMGKKEEVVHGAKNNPNKVYKRRAKNETLRKIKKAIKDS